MSLSLWLSLQIGLSKIVSTKKHNTSGNGFTQIFTVVFIHVYETYIFFKLYYIQVMNELYLMHIRPVRDKIRTFSRQVTFLRRWKDKTV